MSDNFVAPVLTPVQRNLEKLLGILDVRKACLLDAEKRLSVQHSRYNSALQERGTAIRLARPADQTAALRRWSSRVLRAADKLARKQQARYRREAAKTAETRGQFNDAQLAYEQARQAAEEAAKLVLAAEALPA